MHDVRFYHLLTTPLEIALPRLVATAYQKNMRVCIVGDGAQLQHIDDALWSYDPQSFLPHVPADMEGAALTPIILALEPSAVNQAHILMILDGQYYTPEPHATFTRIFDLFDGNDEDKVRYARARWKRYSNEGCNLSYAKQRPDGGWDLA